MKILHETNGFLESWDVKSGFSLAPHLMCAKNSFTSSLWSAENVAMFSENLEFVANQEFMKIFQFMNGKKTHARQVDPVTFLSNYLISFIWIKLRVLLIYYNILISVNIDEISLLKISHYRNNEGRTVYWSKPQVLVFFRPCKFRSNRKIKCSLKYDSPSRGHVVLHQPPGFMSGNDSLSCDFVVQIGTRHTHMHVNINTWNFQ